MSVKYIEEFEIDGSTYGIEDYEDGRPKEDHFFGEDHKKTDPRYKLWVGGCSFGTAKTIGGARDKVHQYAKTILTEEITKMEDELEKKRSTFALLGDDSFRLGRFIQPTIHRVEVEK